MDEAAAQSLQENMRQVLLYHSHLVLGGKDQLQILENDLRRFTAFLSESSTHGFSEDRRLQIRNLLYQIEDVFDGFIYRSAKYTKPQNYFRRLFRSPPDLFPLVEDVEGIMKQIVDVKGAVKSDAARASEIEEERIPTMFKSPAVWEDEVPVVGFEDEAQSIIEKLKEWTEELDIISIVGMPGIGKTTLAAKVFRDMENKHEFENCIWVHVSRMYKKRNVFHEILRCFPKVIDDSTLRTDQEILHVLREQLMKVKWLIVLDDVPSSQAWTDLRVAFPISCPQNSKILLTTQSEKVARRASLHTPPHKLRFLTFEESWHLLHLTAFGKSPCPPSMETLGKHLCNSYKGHPHSIRIISQFLQKEDPLVEDKSAQEDLWRMVSQSALRGLVKDPYLKNIFSLSYGDLPHYLKPCFLYLGIFPKDFDIPVWTLVKLWIAEGFIVQNDGMTLEQTARHYLEELIDRNLVMVGKMTANGEIKTCRLHPMFHLFCKNESDFIKENLFQEEEGSKEERSLEQCRRLCVYSSTMDHPPWYQLGGQVHSVLYFLEHEQTLLPADQVLPILAKFKLLKVLHAKPITFAKFPYKLTKLVFLRYIVLSITFEIISEAITELCNMETLVIYTTSRTLTIKANILSMIRLRHLKTSTSTIFPRIKQVQGCNNLQTLGAISPQSCTKDMFDGACTLTELCIRGPLVRLSDIQGLNRLQKLEKLKVINDLYKGPYHGGKSPQLPLAHDFPPNLRSLTLCATLLDWSCMSTLAKLDTLEVLKLKEKAFVGPYWEACGGCGFHSLEVLHIEQTDLVEWVARADHFPRLKHLVLKNCEKLIEIPQALGEVDSFMKLDLEQVGESVVASAVIIQNERRYQEIEQKGSAAFRLSSKRGSH